MPTIGWFIPEGSRDYDRVSASVWIRCLQLIPYLERLGIRSRINEEGEAHDVCMFVRRQDAAASAIAERQRRRGARVVFDLCVNYFDETGLLGTGYGTTAERARECREMVGVADAVTCASAYIAERARAFHPRVAYLPDSVDTAHFRHRKTTPAGGTLVAGWSGTAAKAHELEPILPLLAEHGVSLHVVSDQDPQLQARYSFVRWSYHTFPQEILRADFCISPRVADNPYDLGHSAFKIAVFMAEAVPALASPVPSYVEALANGGGRICDGVDDWARALDDVRRSRGLLATWAQEAVAAVAPYRTDAVAARYADLARQLAE